MQNIPPSPWVHRWDDAPVGIVPDGSGGAFVLTTCIEDWPYRRGPYRLARLSPTGVRGPVIPFGNSIAAWVGVLGYWSEGAIVTSGPGRCIVAWARDWDWAHERVVAQRYDTAGAALWQPNPVKANSVLQGLPSKISLVAESDGDDGTIIVWLTQDPNSYPRLSIRAQRIDQNGQMLWTKDGVEVGNVPNIAWLDQYWLQLVMDGAGGAVVLWAEINTTGLVSYLAHPISANGKPIGVPVTLVSSVPNGWQEAMLRVRRAVTDDSGGLFLVYADRRGELTALRYTPGRGILWSVKVGLPINATAFQVREDGQEGILVSFVSASPSPQVELKRFDSNGALTWSINGLGSVPIQLSLPPGSTAWRTDHWMALAQAVPDNKGGALLIYQDWPANRQGPKLFSACFDVQGILCSPPQEVTTRPTSQEYPVVASPGGVSAVVAWADDGQAASTGLDVWTQRVGCCLSPQPVGELHPQPELFCEILPLPGAPYGELVLRLPCGNRDRQYGVLPLSRLCTGVRGLDYPDCVINSNATCPDWMRIQFWGLTKGFEIQLQNRDGSVIEKARQVDAGKRAKIEAGYHVLTFAPKANVDPVLLFTHTGRQGLDASFVVRIKTEWGEGQPPPLLPSSLKKHAEGRKARM